MNPEHFEHQASMLTTGPPDDWKSQLLTNIVHNKCRLKRSAHWRDKIRYATWFNDFPETRHLSEQQSRSNWSDTIRYTISDTTEGRNNFLGSVVIMISSSEDVVVAYMYLQRRRQKKRRCWVHPYNVRNIKHSSAVACLNTKRNFMNSIRWAQTVLGFWKKWFQHSCRIRTQTSDRRFQQVWWMKSSMICPLAFPSSSACPV
jgi:hypothetical protein